MSDVEWRVWDDDVPKKFDQTLLVKWRGDLMLIKWDKYPGQEPWWFDAHEDLQMCPEFRPDYWFPVPL
jgi:hypothetical protein